MVSGMKVCFQTANSLLNKPQTAAARSAVFQPALIHSAQAEALRHAS
jgi:hypothetical protein